MYRRTALLLFLLLLAACGEIAQPQYDITLVAPGDVPTTTFTDPVLIKGEETYNLVCAHCHGYEGEGQLASTIENTLALGMNTVPPANSTGHMWQHPDQLLIRVVQEGIQNPLDQFPMAAFSPGLSEDDIRAVLAYIRLWWTDEQRAHQAQLTENWAKRLEALGISDATPEATAASAG